MQQRGARVFDDKDGAALCLGGMPLFDNVTVIEASFRYPNST
jgi:hypothetical protein